MHLISTLVTMWLMSYHLISGACHALNELVPSTQARLCFVCRITPLSASPRCTSWPVINAVRVWCVCHAYSWCVCVYICMWTSRVCCVYGRQHNPSVLYPWLCVWACTASSVYVTNYSRGKGNKVSLCHSHQPVCCYAIGMVQFVARVIQIFPSTCDAGVEWRSVALYRLQRLRSLRHSRNHMVLAMCMCVWCGCGCGWAYDVMRWCCCWCWFAYDVMCCDGIP